MFTGLVEQVGELAERTRTASGTRLRVRHAAWHDSLETGESICVSGACLTVAAFGAGWFEADVLDETLARTCLGTRAQGAPLNLERALRANGRLGGHFVTGHVDAVARVLTIGHGGSDWVLGIELPTDLEQEVVLKGSIAIDGVSLTIASLDAARLTVHLIPHTWDHTSLHALRAGESVNVETDLVGKYVLRALGRTRIDGRVTLEMLAGAGYT